MPGRLRRPGTVEYHLLSCRLLRPAPSGRPRRGRPNRSGAVSAGRPAGRVPAGQRCRPEADGVPGRRRGARPRAHRHRGRLGQRIGQECDLEVPDPSADPEQVGSFDDDGGGPARARARTASRSSVSTTRPARPPSATRAGRTGARTLRRRRPGTASPSAACRRPWRRLRPARRSAAARARSSERSAPPR